MTAKIDGKDYIDELLANIRRKDSIKAKILLRHIEDVEPGVRRRLVFELSRCDDEYSLPLLSSLASENTSVAAKMPVLRQVLLSKFLSHPSALLPLLKDGQPSSIAFFAGIAAEVRDPELVDAMILALKDSSCGPEVELAFIAALGDIGCGEAVNFIAERLTSEDVPLSLASAKALGKIATPTAMRRLSECMGRSPELDSIAIGIFAEVQDELSLTMLNEAMLSHSAAVRKLAKDSLVRIGAKAVPMLIDNLLRKDDPDLLIHSLNVIGSIGDRSAVGPVRKLLESEPPDPNVRFAAYEALGSLPLNKGAYVLASGLADPVDNVCIAAAKAIDRNYSDVLSAGVRNLVHSGGEDLRRIMMAVVDAEADNLFMDLLEDAAFKRLALAYLKNKAHLDVRGHFRALLSGRGFAEDAKALEGEKAQPVEAPSRFCMVVDDSKMILSVYRTILHKLGWSPTLFESPSAALEALRKGPAPLLLITDLNMPGMTGIELAAAARALLPASTLPILMVTTQNEPQDTGEAMKAGVGLVMHKPFTEDSLGKAMDSLLPGGAG